ncbi:MAG: four-carbon acid sugar kinase family protein [Blastocatellia bacterium]|nr:four-carbon acid sugar kinase family protein [Blastocatellia bacterium]
MADDLTGAADAGLPFATRGYLTNIWLQHSDGMSSAGVDIYDTASRRDTPESAAAKVRNLSQSLTTRNRLPIFKKIDSTLLGNLAAEIDAALESCGLDVALVAPAFPAMGRTLIGGRLHLFGKPSNPARFLPWLLQTQRAAGVGQVKIEVLQYGSAAVAETLTHLIARGARLIALDGATQDDLRCIVQATQLLDAKAMLAGAGALAAEIAALLPAAGHSEAEPPEPAAQSGRVLLIIGSANPTTEMQLRYLLESRPVVLSEPGELFERRALRDESHVLLCMQPGIDKQFTRVISAITPLLDGELRGIVLSGGDTAEAVARCFEADGIRLLGEITPGIPWGRFIGGKAAGIRVATKAGGFGADEALVKAVDFLVGN